MAKPGVDPAPGARRLNLPAPAVVAYCSIPFFQLVAATGVHWANTPDGAYLTWCNYAVDNGASERELGVRFRPVEGSVRDTVAWLTSAGQLRT